MASDFQLMNVSMKRRLNRTKRSRDDDEGTDYVG